MHRTTGLCVQIVVIICRGTEGIPLTHGPLRRNEINIVGLGHGKLEARRAEPGWGLGEEQ